MRVSLALRRACILLATLFQVPLIIGGSQENVTNQNEIVGSDELTEKSLLQFIHDRWTNREDLVNLLTDSLSYNHPAYRDNKSKQEYACGRSIVDKRQNDQMTSNEVAMNELNLFGLPKNKYRPTEIRMPRIIGGDQTSPGEFPWTASVKLNGQPICGGSLIDRSWILTAAHCVVGYNPKNLTIRLGAYRIKDSTETQIVDLPISLFIVHKEYSMPRPFSNDIALLKLIEAVDYTDYIIPICLPDEDHISGSAQAQMGANVHSTFDYKMKKLGSTNIGLSALTTAESDSGGIVVSTKMTDSDIAKCFNRIEQNYLNSIGLGNLETESSVTKDQSITNNHRLSSTTTSRPESVTKDTALPTPSPPDFSLSIDTLVDLLEPSYDVSSDNRVANTATIDREQFSQGQRYVDRNSNAVYTTLQPGATNPLSHQSFTSKPYEGQYQASGINQESNQAVYYNLPWARQRNIGQPHDPRHESMKLSKLAVNKELLREIQSLGASSMQNLGLHHGEIMAMANDLTSDDDKGKKPQENSPRQPESQPHSTNYGTRHTNNVLRSPSMDLDETIVDSSRYSGLSGIVVGWGWVREQDGDESLNKGYPSVTLQKVKLPILRNNVCEAWFQSQAKKITLLPSQFCAGFNSGGKDACRGDSGGPMVIEDNADSGRYQLIGIVSAGIGCARPSLPGLYTRVASFLPWIKAQIDRY